MKCGANAKPPSNDPCAACLGPGFISIMRSIYSVVMTWGYEKSQLLLKTQAHPPNPVWKDGLIHRWNPHDMSAQSGKPPCYHCLERANWCLNKQQWHRISVYLWILNRAGLHLCTAFNIIAIQTVFAFVFTLTPQYIIEECLLFSSEDGSVFREV